MKTDECHDVIYFTGFTFESIQVFVGLGFPYEGPAPLEAIANGAVFLNPVFDVPKDSLNTPFFKVIYSFTFYRF